MRAKYTLSGVMRCEPESPMRKRPPGSPLGSHSGLFRVECGHADGARVLGIDVEVPDDERTSTPAHLKDLDYAPSYVPLRCCPGSLQQM